MRVESAFGISGKDYPNLVVLLPISAFLRQFKLNLSMSAEALGSTIVPIVQIQYLEN
jgi:hypothetical protein